MTNSFRFFMKHLLTVFLFSIAINTFAQTPFEGKIEYNVSVPEKDGNGIMLIYFSKPGIRLEFIESNRPLKLQETVIINLDSGKIFTLNTSEKEYTESLLKKKHSSLLPLNKTIAGFNTAPVTVEFPAARGSLYSIFSDPVLYPANDLYYVVPEMYKQNPELMMVYKGRIVLGGEFFMPEYPDNQWNLNKTIDNAQQRKNVFTVFANKATAEPLAPSLFVVPADYTKEKDYQYGRDSAWVMPDTTVPYLADTTYMVDSVYTPQQKAPARKKKSPPSKKSTTKQNSIHRKDD